MSRILPWVIVGLLVACVAVGVVQRGRRRAVEPSTATENVTVTPSSPDISGADPVHPGSNPDWNAVVEKMIEASKEDAPSTSQPPSEGSPGATGQPVPRNTSGEALSPKDTRLRQRFIESSVASARERLRAGLLEPAFDVMDEATRAAGDEASLRKRVTAGYVAMARDELTASHLDTARRAARNGLEIDPDSAGVRLVLGDISTAQNDLKGAIDEWETGLRRNPGDPPLRGRLEHAHREAAVVGTFATSSSPHFTVVYEGENDQEAAAFALEILETAVDRVGEVFDFVPKERVPVVLYPGQTFESVEGRPAWSHGVYDGKIRVPTLGALAHQSNFRATVAHEYAHAVFARVTGGAAAPAWLNEGMAEFAAATVEPSPEITCAWGHGLPIRTLEAPFSRLGLGRARLAYPEARHAVERLAANGGTTRLRDLLRALKRGLAFGDAFSHTYDRSFGEFADRFDRQEE
jgi:tetratricopeptide (TPR) repeat protein